MCSADQSSLPWVAIPCEKALYDHWITSVAVWFHFPFPFFLFPSFCLCILFYYCYIIIVLLSLYFSQIIVLLVAPRLGDLAGFLFLSFCPRRGAKRGLGGEVGAPTEPFFTETLAEV